MHQPFPETLEARNRMPYKEAVYALSLICSRPTCDEPVEPPVLRANIAAYMGSRWTSRASAAPTGFQRLVGGEEALNH